ncbi:MAG: T9SS type A sorting domain-containing protein [Ignavibacteria bacterium]|nr:T9SS type A sorting domain-containing protein [Ignavibacteria bacterium]
MKKRKGAGKKEFKSKNSKDSITKFFPIIILNIIFITDRINRLFRINKQINPVMNKYVKNTVSFSDRIFIIVFITLMCFFLFSGKSISNTANQDFSPSELGIKIVNDRVTENDTVATGFFDYQDYFFDAAVYSHSKQKLTIYLNQRNGKLSLYREYDFAGVKYIKANTINEGHYPYPLTELTIIFKDGSSKIIGNFQNDAVNDKPFNILLEDIFEKSPVFIYGISWIKQYQSERSGIPQYYVTVGDIDKDGKNEAIYTFFPINDTTGPQFKPTRIVVFEYVNDNYYRIDWDTLLQQGGFNIGRSIVDFDKNGNYEFIAKSRDGLGNLTQGVFECTGEEKYKFYHCSFGTSDKLSDYEILDSVYHQGQYRTEIWCLFNGEHTSIERWRYDSRNNTDYGFDPMSGMWFLNSFVYDIAVGDIDRDGKEEIILGDTQFGTNFIDYMDSTGVSPQSQNGWEMKTIIPNIPVAPGFSYTKDYDNCGYPEFTVTGVGSGSGCIATLKHNGSPGQNQFQVMWWDTSNVFAGPNMDIDTGYIDNYYSILYPTDNNYYHIIILHLYTFSRNGIYTFARTSTYYKDSTSTVHAALFDIDNDGKQNVVTAGAINPPGIQGVHACFFVFEQLGTIGIKPIGTEIPKGFYLGQNYPNPFNSMTNVKFEMLNSGMVEIKVFDLLGREVRTLVNEYKQAGSYVISFNGSGLSSGVYFYRMKAGNFVQVKRMVLIK